jgi:hypothetical protein
MTTYHMVYQIFVVYICVKAAILLPLAWFTFLVRRAEKQKELLAAQSAQAGQQFARSAESANDDRVLDLPETASRYGFGISASGSRL